MCEWGTELEEMEGNPCNPCNPCSSLAFRKLAVAAVSHSSTSGTEWLMSRAGAPEASGLRIECAAAPHALRLSAAYAPLLKPNHDAPTEEGIAEGEGMAG